jgi:hypothetical protein
MIFKKKPSFEVYESAVGSRMENYSMVHISSKIKKKPKDMPIYGYKELSPI